MRGKPLEPHPALARFGQHLAQLRKSAEMSQEELSHRCELDRTYISGVECGKRNLSLGNVLRIAKALGTHPKNLLDYPHAERIEGFAENWKK